MRVPLFDGAREARGFTEDLAGAAQRVLSSGHYILGPEVEAFETEIGRYLGVPHAIGVASGTDALWLALKALDLEPGSGVLTSPFTFFATASAIINAGLRPVVADVDEGTLNLDTRAARAVLEGRSEPHRRPAVDPPAVTAILPVHVFGQPADMDPILDLAGEFGLPVIEDAAQALGAEYGSRKAGTLGDLGCFSFFPTKNLGGFGDGGLVVCADEALAERLRLLRAHGSAERYVHRLVGTNSRLDALQAALLRVRLEHLDDALRSRARHAKAYDDGLSETAGLKTPFRAPGRTHSFHQYAVRVSAGSRDAVRRDLQVRGVETAVHYPIPLHLQQAFEPLGYQRDDFPVAEAASTQLLSLPMFPSLSDAERDHVVLAVTQVVEQAGALYPVGSES